MDAVIELEPSPCSICGKLSYAGKAHFDCMLLELIKQLDTLNENIKNLDIVGQNVMDKRNLWKALKEIIPLLSNEQKEILCEKWSHNVEPDLRWLAHDIREGKYDG